MGGTGMNAWRQRGTRWWGLILVGALLAGACAGGSEDQSVAEGPAAEPESERAPVEELPASADKWSLWTHGTQLRGANLWQRIVVPEVDGPDFLGSGYIGPPVEPSDLEALAALGANVINLSHPGLFTERLPYVVDEQAQANLDRLIDMAAQADLFVVITFRTGPGRSDFTFYRDGAGDWFDEDLLIETVWTEAEAQDAWAEMWRYTAERYRDNPVVVGYDLMCEPNGEGIA
ncbi:MAG: glycoside hydrolase family 5 protein, partial [Chloroflexi bacterium]|nr:glycoside hydrolase family 5 protein [Chloroflexota bacterium]